jgi:hypothetical protein
MKIQEKRKGKRTKTENGEQTGKNRTKQGKNEIRRKNGEKLTRVYLESIHIDLHPLTQILKLTVQLVDHTAPPPTL